MLSQLVCNSKSIYVCFCSVLFFTLVLSVESGLTALRPRLIRVISKGIKKLGCTTFRLNPFRRIDTSSNTKIGL